MVKNDVIQFYYEFFAQLKTKTTYIDSSHCFNKLSILKSNRVNVMLEEEMFISQNTKL